MSFLFGQPDTKTAPVLAAKAASRSAVAMMAKPSHYKLPGFRVYKIKCTNVYTISSDSSGIVANFATSDPRSDPAWSSLSTLFDAFCVTGLEVSLTPFKNNWTGGLVLSRDCDGVAAISYQQAVQREDKKLYSPLCTDVPSMRIAFSPNGQIAELAGGTTATASPGLWYDTAKTDLVFRGGLQINSLDNVVSVGTFRVIVTFDVLFASKQL